MYYRYEEMTYHIVVAKKFGEAGVSGVTVDGLDRLDKSILLVDDKQEHMVTVTVNF